MPDIAPRRWLYLFLVLASTAAATQMAVVFQMDGFSLREIAIMILFAILFAWIASSFWLAAFGAWARFAKINLLPLKPAGGPSAARTAILMPIYNEDVAGVFSGVRAVWESAGADFDFYILSDSTNPANWVAEELEWQKLKSGLGEGAHVFYRHRARNIGRKAGNIQDFCENWGQLYDYMVILDADSLMTGKALAQLVGLMDANPRVALIQAPARLVGRNSLFARIQQFSSSVYSPIYTAGLALLQGADGNYWGHNAIVRVQAFMLHCGLPRLPRQAALRRRNHEPRFHRGSAAAPRRMGNLDGAGHWRFVRRATAQPDGLSDPRPALVSGQHAASADYFCARADIAQPPSSGDGDHELFFFATVAPASDHLGRGHDEC